MISVCCTSDHHFFHSRILEYCNRPYDSVERMNDSLIKLWNTVVEKDDIVIHLGDIFVGGSHVQHKEVMDQLNGKYKILVQGNHDRKTLTYFKSIGFHHMHRKPWVVGQYMFSHAYRDADALLQKNVRYNLHGHNHKHDYGDPYFNFCVDVVRFKPKRVKLNLDESDLIKDVYKDVHDEINDLAKEVGERYFNGTHRDVDEVL